MSKRSIILPLLVVSAFSSITLTSCGRGTKKDTYDKEGKLKVHLRNLYFDNYVGGDPYLKEIEKKFNLSLTIEPYSWSAWEQTVNGSVLADNVPDVFHMDIDSYNFSNYYKYWSEAEVTKQLPDDLSRWKNLENMINNTTNIDALKLNGHLYGIPIAKNTTDYSTTFSPFTYIYRRDLAKKYGVYQENDEYTWEQFLAVVDEFSKHDSGLGDVEWGFPSITNFYKQVPHCFAQDENGIYVNNYTTEAYLDGLDMSKTFKNNGWYNLDQNTPVDGDINKAYLRGECGILYENLSYSNYLKIKNKFSTNPDATAIMKVRGPDGKYALEGTDNWFSMTFFDYKISDEKMEKILDLLDWLLSEEGTRFAIYGFEGYDYKLENGQVVLYEESWPKDKDGHYVEKINGGRYLRYMASLGYDTLNYDPLSDKETINYLESWEGEMRDALDKGELRILIENPKVRWLTSKEKALHSGLLRTNALKNVKKYIYNSIKTREAFVTEINKDENWEPVLKEINNILN